MDPFTMLLDKLRQQQSYCPYCSGEHAHSGECPLRGRWFDDERGEQRSPFLNPYWGEADDDE